MRRVLVLLLPAAALSACGDEAPSRPSDLAQALVAPAAQALAAGAQACIQPLVVGGVLSSPDRKKLVLEVELRAAGEALVRKATHRSGQVASGQRASLEIGGLAPGLGWHWAARAMDADGAASAWVSFGGNAEDAPDFATCADAPTMVPAAVTVDAPAGVSTAGWQVKAGLLASAPLGSPLYVLDDQPQLLAATDAQGRIALLGLKAPGVQSVTLGPRSTAQALAVLTGMVVGEYWDNPAGVQQVLDETAQLTSAGELIAQKLPGDPQALLDPAVLDAVTDGAEAALVSLAAHRKATWPRPLDMNLAGGVRMEKIGTVSDGQLSLEVTNHKLRWLAAYVEKEDGTLVMAKAYVKAADMVQLYPPKAPSPSKETLDFQLDGTGAKVFLKLYGAGEATPEWKDDPERQRAFAPTVFTTIDNFVVPAIGLFIRVKDAAHSPAVKVPTREKLVAAIAEDFTEKWKTGESLELALTMTRSMVYAVLSNEKGVGEALLKDLAEGLAWDALLASAANYIPLVREIKLGVELSQRAMTIILTTRDLFSLARLTKLDVQNAVPEFEALVGPTEGLAPLSVTMSAIKSPELIAARYDWDFEGDGVWDSTNDIFAAAAHTYEQEGTYHCRLRVTDVDGAEGTDEVEIHVYTPGMQVEDGLGVITLGPAGGPFTVPSRTYFVSSSVNADAATVSWKATADESWVTIARSEGVAGFSPTEVAVGIDAAATESLPPGPWEATVTFTNLTNGKGNTTRRVALQIVPPVTVTPDAIFTATKPSGGSFADASTTYTVATDGTTSVEFTAGAGFDTWVTVSPAQGTATGAGALVTVSLNAAADELTAGEHAATVVFKYKASGLVFAERTVKAVVEETSVVGVVDTSFGASGIVTSGGRMASVAVDAAGNIVAAGQQSGVFMLWRFKPDGTTDTSFGTGGQAVHQSPLGSYGLSPAEMALDAQGRIVVVTETYDSGGYSNLGVARFTPSGDADSTFGTTGWLVVDRGGGSNELVPYGVAVDSQDRVVLTGYKYTGAAHEDVLVARVTTAGALDASFGGGLVLLDQVGATGFTTSEWGNAVAVDAQGLVLVGGRVDRDFEDNVMLLRFTTGGALDPTFGAGGKAFSLAGSTSGLAECFGLALDGGSEPVVGGRAYYASGYEGIVARFNAGGAPDDAFGTSGYVRTGGPRYDTQVARVATDGAGNVLAAGTIQGALAVWRYLPSGAPDPAFGEGDGVATVAGAGGASDMAVDGQGRIVVANGKLVRIR